MFKAVCNHIRFSFLGITKIALVLVFFCLAVFFVFKSKDLSAFSTASLSSYFNSSNKISLLNTHLTESKWSTELDDLSIDNISPEEAEIFLFILRLSENINPTDASKLAKLIVEECGKNDLDPYLILAVIQIESDFIPRAVSSKGAIGLMQVMPKTNELIMSNI